MEGEQDRFIEDERQTYSPLPDMKLISLNTWGGKIFEPFIDFINQYQEDTDIFCFQEMENTKSKVKGYKGIRANLLQETIDVLKNFQVFYFPVMSGYDDQPEPVNFDLSVGQAIFIKNKIKIISHGDYFVNKKENFQQLKKDFSNLPTPLQHISFKINDKQFSVFNFHGTPFPGNKLDTDERLTETRKVKEIMDIKVGAKILVGDFNLLPQTKCIKIYEEEMTNLIKKLKIQRTRSKLSPYYGREDFQKFADYIFVSKDIKIINFEVPKMEISDHLPMILKFS